MKKILNRISKIISSSSEEINENLKKYKGEIIVIKYGGSAMLNPVLSETFFKDIKLLVEANIRPIIVHGGGPQINENLKALFLSKSVKYNFILSFEIICLTISKSPYLT